MSKLLEIKNLSKKYHTKEGEILAIKNLNIDIEKGEFIALVGTSGCGKSTLLNIIAGLDQKSSGSINFYNNNDVTIGYMFQSDCLFPWLTIYENALLGLKIKNKNTKENQEYVLNLLKKYNLLEFKDKYPKCLSGGMKQRVALIRTLALKPDILLLDEPFNALDYQSRLAVSKDVYDIIKSENQTAIIVTHDLAEAISMSDKIYVLSKRPCTVKKIYEIKLNDKKDPINNRKDEKFCWYYDKIWKDLDINV
jgi:NitT/TauT family transport system ATP-binding protein